MHTGYDWNQYNKKHYDIDNPPPKTVQGYKFNVCINFKMKKKDHSVFPCNSWPQIFQILFTLINRFKSLAESKLGALFSKNTGFDKKGLNRVKIRK